MIEVVDARPDDVGLLRDITQRAYGRYVARIGRRPAPMSADYTALVDAGHVRVAAVDGEVVGVVVMWREADHWYVDSVAVDPSHQGAGVGTALLCDADRAAREAGCDRVRLYTNLSMTENLGYYSRRGFVETHRAEQDGFQRVFLVRRLHRCVG
jgi:ribosomal protein S18 acetylase RimI-like enzyme